MKWAIGTGIAALALILGIIQWLYPQGGHPGPSGQPSATVSASPKPKSDFEQTPMIGYEFWQNGEPALMQRGTETTAGYVTYVTLAREPFEIRLPKPPGEEAVRIVAWSDDSIFSIPQGAEYADHQQFGMGHGMANGERFDGDLYLDNQAMNYLVGNRLQPIDSAKDKILVSAFSGNPIAQRSEPVYLTIFIDDNSNGRFDITEYEYIVLKFRSA